MTAKKPSIVKQLATKIGKTERTIRDYRSAGMPTTNLKDALAWIKSEINTEIGQVSIGERKAGKTRRGDEDLYELEIEELRAKIDKLTAETEARELKNAQIRGELYEADDVERQVAELTSMIRTRLESIPDELQTEWPLELRATVTQRMAAKIHLILKEMSQWRLDVGNVQPGDSEPKPASAEATDSLELGEHTDA